MKLNRFSFFLSLALLLFSTACQLKPTKVSESARVDSRDLLRRLDAPIQVDESTVVIDARSAFEYATIKIPGSINMRWEDLAQPQAKFKGKTPTDLVALGRRLSLLGLDPKVPVVVVGNGAAGAGEDGRIAWSLLHLGFTSVQLANVDYFKANMNNAEPPVRANKPVWTPAVRKDLEASREEVQKITTTLLKEGQRKSSYLLDVRTKKEYFHKGGLGEGYSTPDLGALHVTWTEFFGADGRPNREIRNQLLALGWQPGDRIVTISDHGVRSGAVAFALMNMGFSNVANYTGGYSELTSAPALKAKPAKPSRKSKTK